MKFKKWISNCWYLLSYHFIRPKLIVKQASFSGDGSFIDIRFWLSRPDKIALKTHPYLLTAQNQKLVLLNIAKFGRIQTKLRKHTNAGMLLFYNTNHTVSSGDYFTLCWDNLKAENIFVR